MSGTRTAFALAGLGGNNAHGAGFLAAAQQVQRQRNDAAAGAVAVGGTAAGSAGDEGAAGAYAGAGDPIRAERARRGILTELEFISCTSGAIATTATYLRGGDLSAELEERITAVERLAGLPRAP
jgi:hypothetical protein